MSWQPVRVEAFVVCHATSRLRGCLRQAARYEALGAAPSLLLWEMGRLLGDGRGLEGTKNKEQRTKNKRHEDVTGRRGTRRRSGLDDVRIHVSGVCGPTVGCVAADDCWCWC